MEGGTTRILNHAAEFTAAVTDEAVRPLAPPYARDGAAELTRHLLDITTPIAHLRVPLTRWLRAPRTSTVPSW
jgi:hypothetical protein